VANKVVFTFIAQDKFNRVAREMNRLTVAAKRNFRGLAGQVRQAGAQLDNLARKAGKAGKKLKDVGKDISAKVTLPIMAAGGAALYQSAKFEQLGIAFEVMTGSAEKGRKVLEDITKFTATTPFQLGEVSDAAKQLLSFGVAGDQITDVLRKLGDVAAGTGKPLTEFSLIYGKILAKGKVQGDELLQLSEKGVALQTILAKKYGVSVATIMQMVAKGQVTFKMFDDALTGMTTNGGKFFELTKKQSLSLGGLWSTFLDNINLLLKAVGDTFVQSFDIKQVLSDTITWLGKATQTFISFAKAHPGLVKLGFAVAGIALVLGPLLVMIGSLAMLLPIITAGFGVLAAIAGALLSPFVLIPAAIAAVVAAGVYLYKHFKIVRTVVDAVAHAIVSVFNAAVENVKAAIETVTGIFNKAQEFGRKIGTWVGEKVVAVRHTMGFDKAPAVSNSSRTDVNVNLRGPASAVESVKSSTRGNVPGMNVGVNMAATGAW